jgi:uncharacterized OsmC-like protein
MTTQDGIKRKLNRAAKAVSLNPSLGRDTMRSTTRITSGLACTTKEGAWEIRSDASEAIGGNSSAPGPGVLGRAALGSCLAIGYMLWASKHDVPIKSLEVEIQADSDGGGSFGTSDVFPGYLEVRYCVRVESSASQEEILKVLDVADKHSPHLDVFSRALTCRRQVEMIQSNEV